MERTDEAGDTLTCPAPRRKVGWCAAMPSGRRTGENGRKGGLVRSRKKTIAARRNARRPRPARRKNS
jgi:hypothetical protein